ncbi:ABC transporter ATP-binding protein [Caenibius sp. WL]|uniref:ABC transporter ATP-binding protein n=1 Tax=Caenibius sp. WL TaxID=2872646 RepID=UPI001C998E4C|nr:ABC transporter ATP-binding protein [Caenibius sp. WL]QZP09256.1 ABC transporter ATP-binding protein [Caenibius sp. WL]
MVMIACEGIDVPLGGRTVVHGITARLEPGSLVGVIGPNGAGKSTLVRAMLGLAPLSAGTVRISDMPLRQWDRKALARALAYLPQGQTLHWPLSVGRLVALGRLPHLGPLSPIAAADRTAIEQALHRADVLHLAGRNVLELSGGERARVLLARALAVGAQGLAVDEPLASLDPGHQIDVMELLAREARTGTLVVAVLHDLTMAARYCDRLLLMHRGRLVADGPPATVLTADNLARIYGIGAFIAADADTPMIVPLGRVPASSHKDMA